MIWVRLTPEQREELERISQGMDERMAQRAKMVLLSDQGHVAQRIAEMLHCHQDTVRGWLRRYQQGGMVALAGRPYGRPRGS
jgi:transposase